MKRHRWPITIICTVAALLAGGLLYIRLVPYVPARAVETGAIYCVANQARLTYTYHADTSGELKQLLRSLCATIRTKQSSDMVPVNEMDEMAWQRYEGTANVVLAGETETYYLYFDNIPFEPDYVNLRVRKTETPDGIDRGYTEGQEGRGLYCKADDALIAQVRAYIKEQYEGNGA